MADGLPNLKSSSATSDGNDDLNLGKPFQSQIIPQDWNTAYSGANG